MPNFLKADSRLTLLGESIADLFMAASISGESYHYCLTLRGVKVSRSCSSAEPTLVPGGQSSLYSSDNSYCPNFCGRKTCEVLIIVDGKTFFW